MDLACLGVKGELFCVDVAGGADDSWHRPPHPPPTLHFDVHVLPLVLDTTHNTKQHNFIRQNG